MTRDRILAKVKHELVECLGFSITEIHPNTDITADLGADSLDVAELVMQFEHDFNVKIPSKDIYCDDKALTVSRLVDIIYEAVERRELRDES